jgi:hypothetical protein
MCVDTLHKGENDDDDDDNNNNNMIITSFEKSLVLLVCKPIDLNLSQLYQHTTANPL